MLLSRRLNRAKTTPYRYVGTIWGDEPHTATAEEFAAMLIDSGYDGPIHDHPFYDRRTLEEQREGWYWLNDLKGTINWYSRMGGEEILVPLTDEDRREQTIEYLKLHPALLIAGKVPSHTTMPPGYNHHICLPWYQVRGQPWSLYPEIRLDRAQIQREIELGDNCDGCRVLAVAPDGSQHQIHWNSYTAAWTPWPESWTTIEIPALFPDGSGEEWDMADDCLRDHGLDRAEIENENGGSNDGIVAYCEKHFPDYMAAARDNQVEFLLDAFLAACNGDGSDLDHPDPWGYTLDRYGRRAVPRTPPAIFTY